MRIMNEQTEAKIGRPIKKSNMVLPPLLLLLRLLIVAALDRYWRLVEQVLSTVYDYVVVGGDAFDHRVFAVGRFAELYRNLISDPFSVLLFCNEEKVLPGKLCNRSRRNPKSGILRPDDSCVPKFAD